MTVDLGLENPPPNKDTESATNSDLASWSGEESTQETPEEIAAEAATDQGDEGGAETATETTEDAAWNEPAPEVQEVAKSRDELILERLLNNIFEPETATKYTKCLFYGDMGTRKTIGACDAGGLKVLLVAVEGGQKSLRNHPEIMQHVKVMRVKSVGQIEMLAEQLQKGAFPEFELIVLDTFSELQKMDLDNMVDEGYTRDQTKQRWTPEGKMYQGNTEHMRRIAAAFRNVERNVIFTAHEREDKDDMSRIFKRPDLTDKVAKTLGSYVDVVAHFTAETDDSGEPVFRAQVRRTTGVIAKTRIGNLPTFFEKPSFDTIHQADLTYKTEEKVNQND